LVIKSRRTKKIKNSIKTLLIHVVISILSLIAYIPFHVSAVTWVSEEAAQKHHIYMLIIAITIIISALFLYYYFSGVFLINQGNDYKNIMSVSITLLIGIVFWMTAFCIDLTGGTKILLNSELWQLYSLYYSYCFFFVDEAAISIPYIMLIFCVMPILVMWLGIKNPIMLRNIKNN
jgi:hypothetical protein